MSTSRRTSGPGGSSHLIMALVIASYWALTEIIRADIKDKRKGRP